MWLAGTDPEDCEAPVLTDSREGPVLGRRGSSVLLPDSVPSTFSMAETNIAPLLKRRVYKLCL